MQGLPTNMEERWFLSSVGDTAPRNLEVTLAIVYHDPFKPKVVESSRHPAIGCHSLVGWTPKLLRYSRFHRYVQYTDSKGTILLADV